MKLSKYSIEKLQATADEWEVDDEYYKPMLRYLVYGYSPGGFFNSLLANDMFGAVTRSHPANTINALKRLIGWIGSNFPHEAYGSYDAVNSWSGMEDSERRAILERARLIYTEQQEIMKTLKDTKKHS